MQTLPEFLRAHGFEAALNLPLDGAYHRFDRSGTLSGWFKGRTLKSGQPVVALGDFKTGETKNFIGSGEPLSAAAEAALRAELAEMEALEKKDRLEAQIAAAAEAEAEWEDAIDRGRTPYLDAKGLAGLHGARICGNYPDTLLIPGRDVDGKLWTLQRILGKKTEAGLGKLMKKGGRVEACFFQLGEFTDEGEIYVCEGYATGCSIYEATGVPVLCAFSAGNLLSVLGALHDRYPKLGIRICGDDDRFTTRPDGRPWNPGREKALGAAAACGGTAVFPVFASLDGRPTDFNDLHAREGLARVKACVEAAPEPPPSASGTPPPDPEGNVFNPLRVSPLGVRYTKTGIPMPPSQQAIVEHALHFFARRLMKQDRDLFYYIGTHWQLLTLHDQDKLRVMIQRICGGIADVKHIDATYKLFVYHLPSPPPYVNFFVGHPFCVNFKNGTLHLRKKGRKFETEFLPHTSTDFLTHVLPYDYRAGDTTRNGEFDAMLERVFLGDADIGEKVRAVRQMYGACLLPAFPRLFMLHGKPGTGKSTVINIAARLVHKDNLCSVPPSQWGGFNMEGMAMKLVNVDTDIPLHEAINDDLVKKVIERKSFRIRRKGVKDLMAPIPSVHLFGGNGLPKTLDGASRAHTRRWTFIEFQAFVAAGNYDQFYWDYCFEQSPEGVLNFALEGLKDLCEAGGHFMNPASGVEAIEEMQDRNDLIALFLRAVQEREVPEKYRQWIVGPGAKIEKKEIWLGFLEWHEENFKNEYKKGKNTFYSAVRSKLGREVTVDGVRYFRGLGPASEGTAPY